MEKQVPFTDLSAARRQLFLLSTMIFITMYGRVVFSPLLPLIQTEFGIGPARGARFFLTIGVTYGISILANGHIASALHHRGAISLTAMSVGIGLIVIATAHHLLQLEAGFVLIGFGAGVYPPSGITSVTALVSEKIRGRAISFHELGSNTSLVVAPFIVTLFSPHWRLLVLLSGIAALIMALIFYRSTLAGHFSGEPIRTDNLSIVIRMPRFWAITFLFVGAGCATLGIYAILPTFLETAMNWDSEFVNTLLGASRISGLLMIYVAGYVIDRYGPGLVITIIFIVTGTLTTAIGICSGTPLAVVVFLQPVVIAAFFPAAVSVLAGIGPPNISSVAVALAIPAVNLLASGVYPTILGHLVERGATNAGFLATGIVMLAGLGLVPMLRQKETS